MPIGLLQELHHSRPQGVRMLGLDLGTKTIGLALSDTRQSLITPLKTIQRGKFADDLKAIGAVVKDYEIGGFVLGWPLNMDGTISASCDRVRSFADEMKNNPQALGMNPGTELWIAFWDERLTTSASQDFLAGDRAMQPSKRKNVVDALAAQLILEGALSYAP